MEGGAVLTPDNQEEAAQSLARLRDMGVFHAIVMVHPFHMAQAAPILEAFGARHLPSLR